MLLIEATGGYNFGVNKFAVPLLFADVDANDRLEPPRESARAELIEKRPSAVRRVTDSFGKATLALTSSVSRGTLLHVFAEKDGYQPSY